MRTLASERSLTIDRSADEVWDWLSDVRNVMTANQFHESVECKERIIGPGPVLPILHNVFGRRNVRLARITQYKKYHVSWGERLAEGYGPDTFPHSIHWRVEPVDEGHCTVYSAIRGRYNAPLSSLLGPYVWQLMIPPVIEADLEDVAIAVGALQQKSELRLAPELPVLMRLMSARTVDATPVEELVASLTS